MAANYGWALSFLKSHKELWKLFNKAVDKTWSVNRFVAALRGTKWFKHHSETWRQTEVLKKTDPKTYSQRMTHISDKVRDMAGSLGADVSGKQRDAIAHNAMWFGWDDVQLRNALANYVDQMGDSGHYGGEAGKAEQELRDYAHNMGIKISDPSLKEWLKNIVAQNQSTDDYRAYLQGQAEHTFAPLADKIKQGVSVKDLAEPYTQQMAQTLELSPSQLDLFDPTIRKALQYQDPQGKVGMVPLWKFEQDLKKDERWKTTNNAKTALVGTAQQVLKDWGFHF